MYNTFTDLFRIITIIKIKKISIAICQKLIVYHFPSMYFIRKYRYIHTMKKAYMICIYNEEIIYMLNEVKCLYFPRKVENGIVGIHCLWLTKKYF